MILLVGATILAAINPAPLLFHPWLLVLGFLLAGYAMFIRMYKSQLLVRFAAVESVQQSVMPPMIVETPNMTMQIELGGFGSAIGKFLGKGYILASRVIEIMVLSSAAIVAFLFLIFVYFGRSNPLPFIGAWLLLVGILWMILSRIPMLNVFTHGDALVFGLLDVTRWAVDSLSLWVFLMGIGYSVNPVSLFLVLSILLLLEKIPSSYYGFGQNELLGEIIINVFGISMGPAFIALFMWDVSRLVASALMSASLENMQMRRMRMELV